MGPKKPAKGKPGGKPGQPSPTKPHDRRMEFPPLDSVTAGSTEPLAFDQKMHQAAREKDSLYTCPETKYGLKWTFKQKDKPDGKSGSTARLRNAVSTLPDTTVTSFGSAETRDSSFTRRNNEARGCEIDEAPVERIGQGLNGIVYDFVAQPVLSERFNAMSEDRKKKVNSRRTASLKNFPFYIDELWDLHMEPDLYARDMAVGLATAHFGACMHTSDAEFVIGCRRMNDTSAAFTVARDVEAKTFPMPQTNQIGPNDEESGNFRNRAIQIWMVDFGGCKKFKLPITANSEHDSFRRFVDECRATNPFFYPSSMVDNEDFLLFADFCSTYIKAANRIQDHKLIISGLEEAVNKKAYDTIMLQPALIMFAWMSADYQLATDGRVPYERLQELARQCNWMEHIRDMTDMVLKAEEMWKAEKAEKAANAGKTMANKATQTE
ncbi:hypothetical protein CMUS01_03292 [Colletotrichum musicola]|uniref:DUF3669 domain-containing protein n=1 Tax=Colletotrichum musicola TaxID=2175873 RepID=A0A8H6NTD9_9PEZI|nr:hypothetical protein CMUS01_03292 [Colletotrichum musicola]